VLGKPGHRRLVVVGRRQEHRRHDALLDDHARTVEVPDEGVERAHALHQPGLEVAPFLGGQHARHRIDRERLVGERRAVHADPIGDLLLQLDEVRSPELAEQRGVVRARDPRPRAGLVVHCAVVPAQGPTASPTIGVC
jgi:hypothetical protein